MQTERELFSPALFRRDGCGNDQPQFRNGERNGRLVFFCFVLVVGVELIDRVYYCIVEVVKLATELLEVVEQVAVLIFYTVLM